MENAAQMRELNDDMQEYLMLAKPGTSIIDEMNNAFEGKADSNFIYEVYEERKTKTSDGDPESVFRVKKVGMKAQKRVSTKDIKEMMKEPLEAIKEDPMIENDMQLVPVTYDNQKKARNEILKQKAKLLKNGIPQQSNGAKVLYDSDLFEPPTKEKTFVTGGGVPGKKRRAFNG